MLRVQAAGQPLLQHLSLTNLAIGTLYCSKGDTLQLHAGVLHAWLYHP